MLGIAILVAGILTSAPSSRAERAELTAAEPSGSACPALAFYGARGSGEDAKKYGGFGQTVQQFEQTLGTLSGKVAALSDITAGNAFAVDYPAIPVGYALQDYTGAYNNSVTAGENTLETDLLSQWHECPNTYVVLAGYSQGAQVVANVADGLNRHWRNQIAAVALFGDPEFNPYQPKVDAATGYFPWLYGIAAYWHLFGENDGLRNVPSDLVPRFHSYCIPLDPICQFTPAVAAMCAFFTHTPNPQACPHVDYVVQRWPRAAAYWAAGARDRQVGGLGRGVITSARMSCLTAEPGR